MSASLKADEAGMNAGLRTEPSASSDPRRLASAADAPFANGARRWIDAGFPVFPLRGKHPAVATRDGGHGVLDATADEAELERRFPLSRFGRCNIGIATGPAANAWGLDVDPRKRGIESLGFLEAELDPVGDTLRQRTGSGGRHLLFRLDGAPIKNSAGKVAEGLDVRGAGGYLVAAPSVHPDTGKPYLVEGPDRLAAAPAWLINLAIGVDEGATDPPPPPAPRRPPISDWGPRPAYARAALDGAARAIEAADDGFQEATLAHESYAIGRLIGAGLMPKAFAIDVLIAAGVSMRTFKKWHPWTRAEVERRVRQAIGEGEAHPRVPEERR